MCLVCFVLQGTLINDAINAHGEEELDSESMLVVADNGELKVQQIEATIEEEPAEIETHEGDVDETIVTEHTEENNTVEGSSISEPSTEEPNDTNESKPNDDLPHETNEGE